MKRVILIVMDGVGIGEMPDAHSYKDSGSNTLCNTAASVGGLKLNCLSMLGIGNIAASVGGHLDGVPETEESIGYYGAMAERSVGKDTMTGHFEMVGIVQSMPMPTYPNGFPKDLIGQIENAIGMPVISLGPASGTEVIKEFGQLHLENGKPIIYTSADSVLQVAAHEDVIPRDELYRICRIIRKIMVGPNGVGRVIARPFAGAVGEFYRTNGRHDYALKPPSPNMLTMLKDAGLEVMACGKIDDIFSMCGITSTNHTADNESTFNAMISYLKGGKDGLIFVNLIDFDQKYGHRNDVHGFAKAVEDFDRKLPLMMELMCDEDLLIITADHGNDPTTLSTDHSREYVPLMVYSPKFKRSGSLGIRSTFSDIGATVVEYFGLTWNLKDGTSFLAEMN